MLISCFSFLLTVQPDSYGTGTYLLVVLGKGGSKWAAQPTNGGLLCVLAFCLLFWKLPIFCNSGRILFAFQSEVWFIIPTSSIFTFFLNPFPWSAKTFSIEHWLTRKFFCQLNNLFFMRGRGFFSEPSATTNKGFSLWYYLHSHHCSLLTWASFKELEVIFNKGQNIFTLNLYLAKETFLQWPPVNSVHCRIYWGILVTLVVFFIPGVLKSPEERVDQ